MEVIDVPLRYTSRRHTISIYPIGDIHSGSINSDEDAVEKLITNEILPNPTAYIIGMGDYAECITKNDPRFDHYGLADWVDRDNIIECQRERVVKLFYPVRNRILGLLTGNHEEEIHKRHDNDFVRNICKDLGGVKYGGYQAFIVLHFSRSGGNNRNYTIHAWHGAGSAQSEGAQVMRLMRLVNEIQADIFLMGHLHGFAQYRRPRLLCQHGRIKSVPIIATITGSWLKGYMQPEENQHLNPTYIEQKGYKPCDIGCPVIKISPQNNIVRIEA